MKHYFILISLIFIQTIYSQGNEEYLYELKKMNFNTSLSEITTSYNNGQLYIYRNKPFYKVNSRYYDLYKIEVDDENENSKFKSLSDNINTRFNEGPISFDKKNKLVFVTRNKYSKKELKKYKIKENILEILIYDEVDGDYVFKRNFEYNDSTSSVGHACYSEFTNRLYFSSKVKGGKGGADLYYCDLLPNGMFGKPNSLGRKINTKSNELFPAVNQGVLFFSSAGLDKARRNLNIFYVTELGVLKGEKPKKMDDPFNSKSDEFGIVFKDSISGYLTSTRGNESNLNHDVYYFNIGEPIIKLNEFNLLLTLRKEEIKKLNESNFKVINKKTKKVENKTIVKDGFIVENIKENTTYEIVFDDSLNMSNTEIGPYTKVNLTNIFIQDTLMLKETKEQEILVDNTAVKEDTLTEFVEVEKQLDVDINPKETFKELIQVENIYFSFAGYEILPKSYQSLEKIISYLNKYQNSKLKIAAHTDSRGNSNYNLLLSEKRAISVYKYLLKKGIAANRIIEKVGYGETRLINNCIDNSNCSNTQHEENRRVEFTFVK